MKKSRQIDLRKKPPRLRGQAHVALIIGGIGLFFSAAGVVQYQFHGLVTVIPGRDPVTGSEAAEMLSILALVSGFFSIYGILLMYRAHRISNELKISKESTTTDSGSD